MNAAEFAQFFRSLRLRVIETESCFWYSPVPFVFKSLPVHRLVTPTRSELRKVLATGPALAIRYPTAAGPETADGGMWVCSRRDYDFHLLSQNVRSHTRRGLARCEVRKIEFDYLARYGQALEEDTDLRQFGKSKNKSRVAWDLFCNKAARLPDCEAWGAFVGEQLAAFLVGILVEDCYYIHLQKSSSALLKYYPNNALLFTVVKIKLASPEVGHVSHGPKAFAVKPSLNYFKQSMGFEVQPCHDKVIVNPLLKPLLACKPENLLDKLMSWYPENLLWRRASKALEFVR